MYSGDNKVSERDKHVSFGTYRFSKRHFHEDYMKAIASEMTCIRMHA